MLEDLIARGLGSALYAVVGGEDLKAPDAHWWAMPGAWADRPLVYSGLFAVVVFVALQALSRAALQLGRLLVRDKAELRARGRHLDQLTGKDWLFVWISRTAISLFTFHLLRACAAWRHQAQRVPWLASELSVSNTVLALPALFVVYDFFYHAFHRALHHRWIYRWVHKHHHRQMAPSRGNVDAVNVHPLEFFGGEYCHLLAIYLVSRFLVPVHLYTVLVFVIGAGVLASLNHTRLDVIVGPIFQVRYHDIHHWFPESNYSQFTMFWDHVFGTFKPYPEDKEKKSKK